MIVLDEKPIVKSLPRFVPVIFANGEDDDAPGLQACVDNEPVQFDGHIYEPGEEITILKRHLVFGRPVKALRGGGRIIRIENCFLDI